MLKKIASSSDIAVGGIKAFEVDGKEVLVGNVDGTFHAVERRCGHMNAPCEMGTLRGYILTCPMHYAQFDMRTGKMLKKPFIKSEPEGLPEKFRNFFEHEEEMMEKINTYDLTKFKVIVEGGDIFLEL
ncbi:MAG TPA: Rieske 2Fe-2S domain-containing protein [Chitinivibrionales bacterium]|jgi:nitrite reductase/ring-hydroxylating ferredoxin subunit|nr:Rieske 2Fe-2S domain-containing protein [Chitinivibrionales bacterium]